MELGHDQKPVARRVEGLGKRLHDGTLIRGESETGGIKPIKLPKQPPPPPPPKK